MGLNEWLTELVRVCANFIMCVCANFIMCNVSVLEHLHIVSHTFMGKDCVSHPRIGMNVTLAKCLINFWCKMTETWKLTQHVSCSLSICVCVHDRPLCGWVREYRYQERGGGGGGSCPCCLPKRLSATLPYWSWTHMKIAAGSSNNLIELQHVFNLECQFMSLDASVFSEGAVYCIFIMKRWTHIRYTHTYISSFMCNLLVNIFSRLRVCDVQVLSVWWGRREKVWKRRWNRGQGKRRRGRMEGHCELLPE